ncbi:DUF4440 domain-containing protein [Microbacterium sp. ET2]|uniref:DUF4440 domain-containing protein n=1 Tax=Microbacterium albipurpureum TaxID=3050384 RepID=UPI00259D2B8D|nr:DUF4440 domain-containing protein [Microbacterium sp. ET2 (Ac-2212)]WJL94959.1 DUF4440 domain-containing protein [Microbacterium sp. ET2 (Ac-2212)]
MRLNELLDWERRGWESLCDGTSAHFYGELMTDDAVMVLATGAVMDRSQVRDALAASPTWDSFEIADERLVEVGPGAAALVYRGTARRGMTEPFVAAMTSVYTCIDGEVRLKLYQQTPASA